jgi:tripartite-type tricarboxylate transporter receptor subunit TctC
MPSRSLLALSCFAISLSAAQAQEPVNFYTGKSISMVISSSAGGGYDTLARALARYLPKHIAPQVTITIRNMPGAGGIVATKYLYSVAPKDGLTMGGVQNNTPFEPLLGTKEADYDARNFNWLGSPSYETGLLATMTASGVRNLDDARIKTVTVASSGANSTPSFYARLLNELLKTKLKIVVGYPGQTESFLAMERGEVDGYPSIFWNSLTSTRPEWLRDKKINLIVQYGPQKEPAIADVPSVAEQLSNQDDLLLLRAAIAPLALGRPFLLPPNVPADRVAFMQKAVMETIGDPEFQDEATTLKLGLNEARSPADMKTIVDDAYATPPAIIERLRKIAQE